MRLHKKCTRRQCGFTLGAGNNAKAVWPNRPFAWHRRDASRRTGGVVSGLLEDQSTLERNPDKVCKKVLEPCRYHGQLVGPCVLRIERTILVSWNA
jgi:hypothetical protein